MEKLLQQDDSHRNAKRLSDDYAPQTNDNKFSFFEI